MNQPEQRFDAQIIAAFDQTSIETPFDAPAPSLLWIGKEGQRYPVDLRLHSMFATAMLPILREEEDTPENREWKDAMPAKIAALIQDIPPEFVDLVINGRIQLSLLLNQNGGNAMTRASMTSIAERTYDMGGTVQSFVTQRAYSTAAHLTELSSKRYALPHSNHLWHAHHDGMGNADEETVDECTRKNIEMFQYVVADAHMPEIAVRFQAAEDDPANALNDVFFSGEDLHRFGYVHHLNTNVGEMETAFQQETNLSVDLHQWRTDPIARFFLRSRMEEWALVEHGLRIEFYNDVPDRFAYQIPWEQGRVFSEDDYDQIPLLIQQKFKEYLDRS